MKRSLPLLLATLLLVCSLTACGRNNAPANTGNNNAPMTDNNSRAPENGTVNNGGTNGNGGTGSVTNDVGNAIEDTGRDIRNGVNDVGNALAGNGTGVNNGVGYNANTRTAGPTVRSGHAVNGARTGLGNDPYRTNVY